MKTNVKKTVIPFDDHLIPVYYHEDAHKWKYRLPEVLEQKRSMGKPLVQKYLSTLDSVEIEGSEAILYSTEETGTLALSLY